IHAFMFLWEFSGVPLFQNIVFSSSNAGKISSVFLLLSAIPVFFIKNNRISHEHYYFNDVLRILKSPQVVLFFILSFFFYFSYQVVDYYLGSFLNETGGMSLVYASWALAVILEIPFMPLTSRIFHFKKQNILFMISTLTGSIRFAVLTMHAAGIPAIPILATQLLHGIHFTGYYMGSIFRIKKIFPGHLYGTAYGAYMVLAVSAGGMCGNLLLGSLLHSETAIFNGNLKIFFENKFTYIFIISMGIHIILFFIFMFLPGSSSESKDIYETKKN
ncbi:MAG: MFS transporter, partial [Spirochaetia bacterium]|nr:MFS transporter [Spirochaetia bacterium]